MNQRDLNNSAQPNQDALGKIYGQHSHWQNVFATNPQMYGTSASQAGFYAISRFTTVGFTKILELGAGQGRDTIAFLRAGFDVTAVDFANEALNEIRNLAGEGLSQHLSTLAQDVRLPLEFADQTFDACYAHMLFTMALTTKELEALASQVYRVLRPGGMCIYTVRHIGDPHFRQGTHLGENLYENGGFIVQFFDNELVNRVGKHFTIEDIHEFEEGQLPRKLWRVTMLKN